MLTDQALQLYLGHLNGESLYILYLSTAIRNRFEKEERTRVLIREWDTIRMSQINEANKDESQTECLNMLVSKL